MRAGRKELRSLSEGLRAALERGGSEAFAYEWFIRLAALRCLHARFPTRFESEITGGASALRSMARAARVLPDLFVGWAKLRGTSRSRGVTLAVSRLWGADARASIAAAFASPTALGWLHQYWVNQDKGRVAAKLHRKSGNKIEGEDLVAATCIYTREEHVRFLLQNSLGRMWLALHPRSPLREGWEHLIKDAVSGPPPFGCARDITLIDPACGAGHFLLGALDMLFAMHREEHPKSDPRAVCRLILARNLVGLDIDPRAVRIARALLVMRCIELGGGSPLRLHVVCPTGAHAEFGSLHRPSTGAARTPSDVLLSRRYHVVATNPPFVGFRKLSPRIKAYLARHDPLAASDLAVAFLSRGHAMLAEGGALAVVTPASWLTSTPALPLRRHMMEHGGPRVVASLGQRVFETAPLLFVSLAVVERGARKGEVSMVSPKGDEGLSAAVQRATRVPMSRLRADPSLSLSPSAAVLPVHRTERFAMTGDFFTFADGVWTGDNARDTRAWSEVARADPDWMPASGGHGYCRWYGPVMRVVRASAALRWPHLDRRAGCLEYSRVAGGRLAARMVASRCAAIAGVVSMIGRTGVEDRRLDVLAVFNSRVGTLWLRALVSGLNFNPGYAAKVPLPSVPISGRLRELVEEAVRLKRELARGPAGCEDFANIPAMWERLNRERRLLETEGEVEREVVEVMGIRLRDIESIELPPQTDYEACVRRGMDQQEIEAWFERAAERAGAMVVLGADHSLTV